MRKIFAATVLSSLIASVLFGAAFAWRTSDSARGAALVGSNGFEIAYAPNCDGVLPEPYLAIDETDAELLPIPCHSLIGPNGTSTEVGRGSGKNDGDFKLMVVGGDVGIRALHQTNRDCRAEHFDGAVRLLAPGEIIPPGGEGGKFVAFVSVKPGAPADCQGEVVYYKVTIFAENPGPVATDPELRPAS